MQKKEEKNNKKKTDNIFEKVKPRDYSQNWFCIAASTKLKVMQFSVWKL